MKNNFKFTLPDFPNDHFEYEENIFTGKSVLKQNGIIVKQSKEKGKPFLITTTNQEIVKAFPKGSFPDISAKTLTIAEKKYPMASKLKWYEYVIGALPIVLVLSGGAIGGFIGGAATIINYTLFRTTTSPVNKYLKVLGVNIACFIIIMFAATLFSTLF
ncbi:hypothetical protein SAMN06265349_10614 [Flavobacterium resistens]|uniref:Uncharacterized protein n=1 Tax=Flavobacterium resistens TaxID=443612 RepID=A0A521EYZ0_9FLAO|nr:hypothetical protein [Flavobacterium resistens]MRX69324.1 hypothetical protein [Flavobacterium resistens]SMO89232.1 hypothetical protein SAMN06265349_10614 [Flavobacterium resistens]